MLSRFARRLFAALILTTPIVVLPVVFAGDDAVDSKTTITAESYMLHEKYLASDELEGRGTGQEGNNVAAKYISERFAEYGLKPAGVDGGWLQPFEVKRGKMYTKEQASLAIAGSDEAFAPDVDFVPFGFSATVEEKIEGPLAFAGYCIEAPDAKYDDFAGVDVSGKILLALRFEPQAADESASFGGKSASKHALFSTKVAVAKAKGAKAVIIVNPPGRDPVDDKLTSFSAYANWDSYDLPVIQVTRATAAKLLEKLEVAGDPSTSKLDRLVAALKPEAPAMTKDAGISVAMTLGIKPQVLKTQNVIALLEGDGSTDELIVVGAHFDHLGLAPRSFGGSDNTPVIHNGADDNASGTSGILEMARVLANGPKLRRGVLFMTFSGEEMGLLGSKHYVDHPTVELSRIKAMINLDMIGRLRGKPLLVYGGPTATEFNDLVEGAAKNADISVKLTKALPGNSDHASFHKKEIPVLFPFTGLHGEYHKPEDDWELIDADGAVKVAMMWAAITRELANMKDGPTYQKHEGVGIPDPAFAQIDPAKKDAAAADAKDDKKKDVAAANTPDDTMTAMPKVRLGVAPSYSDDEDTGMLVETVMDGGAAQAGGMKNDDRITQIGDKKIKNVYGYMRALADYKPGDVVEITVLRKGKELKLSITLGGPPQKPGDGANPHGG